MKQPPPSLWRYIPLAEYATPPWPAKEHVRRGWRFFWRSIRRAPRSEVPAVDSAMLAQPPDALLEAVAFASGYGFGVFSGAMPEYPEVFLNSVFKSILPADVFNILAKSLVPAWLSAVICCTEGLSAGASLIEVPLATKRALRRSVAVIFVSFLLISLLTYR